MFLLRITNSGMKVRKCSHFQSYESFAGKVQTLGQKYENVRTSRALIYNQSIFNFLISFTNFMDWSTSKETNLTPALRFLREFNYFSYSVTHKISNNWRPIFCLRFKIDFTSCVQFGKNQGFSQISCVPQQSLSFLRVLQRSLTFLSIPQLFLAFLGIFVLS